MKKFENTAQVGDIIKAYDFMPTSDRPDMFLSGVVIDKGPIYISVAGRMLYAYDGYTVKVVGGDDRYKESMIGETMYVPFERDMMDHDDRITLVATSSQVDKVLA